MEYHFRNILTILISLPMILAPLVLVKRSLREKTSNWFLKKHTRFWLFVPVYSAFYVILSSLSSRYTTEDFVSVVLYFSAIVLLATALPTSYRNKFADIVFVIIAWVSIELKWVQPIWSTVYGEKNTIPSIYFPAMTILLLIAPQWKKMELYCDWKINKDDIKKVLKVFVILAAILLPISYWIDFIEPNLGRTMQNLPWSLFYWAIFIFIASGLLEELFFRCFLLNLLKTQKNKTFLQNMFPKSRWHTGWNGLILTSVLFGLGHINDGMGGRNFPNIPYAIFSAIAAYGYGYIYLSRKSVVAAALLHFLIDYLWISFLMKR